MALRSSELFAMMLGENILCSTSSLPRHYRRDRCKVRVRRKPVETTRDLRSSRGRYGSVQCSARREQRQATSTCFRRSLDDACSDGERWRRTSCPCFVSGRAVSDCWSGPSLDPLCSRATPGRHRRGDHNALLGKSGRDVTIRVLELQTCGTVRALMQSECAPPSHLHR